MILFMSYVKVFVSVLTVNFLTLYFKRNSRIKESIGAPTNPGVKNVLWVDYYYYLYVSYKVFMLDSMI